MIDLHVHSALSDGTDSLPDLVTAAVGAGLDTIALTDHDTMTGVGQAQELGAAAGLEVVRGVEISTHLDQAGRQRTVHLLAYGADPADAGLAALLAETRQVRLGRVPAMIAKLAGLGYPLSDQDIAAVAGNTTTIGRPHLADALVARGYLPSRDVVFKELFYEGGPAYVSHPSPTTDEAVAAVTAAGGVPVVAHPWGRGNQDLMTEAVIARLAERGLAGLEVDHVDHSAAQCEALGQIVARHKLIRTGGSDYHGTGKTRNPLGCRATAPAAYQAIVTAIAERGGTR